MPLQPVKELVPGIYGTRPLPFPPPLMTDLLSPLIDLSFYRLRYNLNMQPLHRNGRKSLKTEQSVLLTGPDDTGL